MRSYRHIGLAVAAVALVLSGVSIAKAASTSPHVLTFYNGWNQSANIYLDCPPSGKKHGKKQADKLSPFSPKKIGKGALEATVASQTFLKQCRSLVFVSQDKKVTCGFSISHRAQTLGYLRPSYVVLEVKGKHKVYHGKTVKKYCYAANKNSPNLVRHVCLLSKGMYCKGTTFVGQDGR